MPVERFAVEGFDAFREKLAEVEKKGKIVIVLFSGSKTKGGKSWCPDCEDAFPVVNHVLDEVEDQVVFLYVGVGGRDFWKDPNCVFRKDPLTRLKCVPTLVNWGTPQRLEEEQCTKKEMVRMMFED